MWEQLTPDDIQRVRHRLALERAAILSRHAEELKAQDTPRDEIETLERLVEAFARKYINSKTSPSQPTTTSEEQPTPAVVADVSEPPNAEVPQQGLVTATRRGRRASAGNQIYAAAIAACHSAAASARKIRSVDREMRWR
jgi:hypothetical protein